LALKGLKILILYKCEAYYSVEKDWYPNNIQLTLKESRIISCWLFACLIEMNILSYPVIGMLVHIENLSVPLNTHTLRNSILITSSLWIS